ncbi:MAG: hypothetical protein ACRDY7_03855, partial [Acidimicrobiia bacterium]
MRIAAVATVVSLALAGSAAGARGANPPPPVDLDGLPTLESLVAGASELLADPEVADFLRPEKRPAQEGLPVTVNPLAGLADGSYGAYATGTVQHTDAGLVGREPGGGGDLGATQEDDEDSDGENGGGENGGGDALAVDVDLANSDSVSVSARLSPRADELGRLVNPSLGAGDAYGRGRPLELLAPSPSGERRSLLAGGQVKTAEAKAPPTDEGVTEQTSDGLHVEGVVRADLFRSQAGARAVENGCVIGSDLSLGLASGDRTDLAGALNQAGSSDPLISVANERPPRAASQSLSRTRLVPLEGKPGHFGVLSETRQSIAPVTLLAGTDEEILVEVGGEWVLRAFADGTNGSVTLGVEGVDDDTPVLRIVQKGEKPVVVTAGQLARQDGPLRNTTSGRNQLVVAERPRAISAEPDAEEPPAATGTFAAGAADVFRFILDPGGSADVVEARIGHMEAAVAVPPGGVVCPGIGVTKRTTPETIAPGDRFTWELTVSNPNDCVLDDVVLVDQAGTTRGMRWRVVSATPQARIEGTKVTFEGIGPLGLGESARLRIDGEVDPSSPPGRFLNQAAAAGKCGSAILRGGVDAQTEVDRPPALAISGAGEVAGPRVR